MPLVLDRGARLIRTAILHYHPNHSDASLGFKPADTAITRFPDPEHGDVIRLELENNQDPWAIGQHYYLCFTKCSIWQSHPFTPLNLPSVSNGIVKHSYLLRAKGGETRKVEKIIVKIVSRPGNRSRAKAYPAMEWKRRASTVIVPATKKVFRM